MPPISVFSKRPREHGLSSLWARGLKTPNPEAQWVHDSGHRFPDLLSLQREKQEAAAKCQPWSFLNSQTGEKIIITVLKFQSEEGPW